MVKIYKILLKNFLLLQFNFSCLFLCMRIKTICSDICSAQFLTTGCFANKLEDLS